MKPLPVVIVAVSWIVCSCTTLTCAASFDNLYTFTPWESSPYTNADGAGINPVIAAGDVLYGSAAEGGLFGSGTLFRINADGGDFTNLYSFTAMSRTNFPPANLDGADPAGELVLSGDMLYGVAYDGGTAGFGTIFRINTDGTGFTNLYSFSAESAQTGNTNSDGAKPRGSLVEGDGVLYGVTETGGNGGDGTIFRINTNGSGFAVIYNFSPEQPGSGTNADGAAPLAGLVLSGSTLFGTTYFGGATDHGVIFSVNTNGTNFTTLYNFSSLDGSGSNVDGACPWSRLLLSGNMLYGTTALGGASGSGAVFSLNPNRTAFNTLYSFTAMSSAGTNSDGARPRSSLVQSGNLLFGTTESGGPGGSGTVFQLCPDGSGFTTLYSFSQGTSTNRTSTNGDGVNPSSRLTLLGNTLIGTTFSGGTGGAGVIFALQGMPSGAIPLQIMAQGNSVVLTWINSTFCLQTAPSFGGLFTNIPGALSPYTNAISGPQIFRLKWSP